MIGTSVLTAILMIRYIARYLFPDYITIIPCVANDNNTRRDNWMNTLVGIERAKGEAMNIVRYVIDGVIPDFEI